MTAPCGRAQHIGQHQNQSDHQDHTQWEHRAAELQLIAKELQERRVIGDVLTADRLIIRIQVVGRQNDLPHAQRYDERRQLHAADQPAVHSADRCAHGQTTGNSRRRRHAIAEGKLAHDYGTEDRNRANRQVNTCRQNNQGLRRSQNTYDLHLLQDQRQSKGRKEFRP